MRCDLVRKPDRSPAMTGCFAIGSIRIRLLCTDPYGSVSIDYYRRHKFAESNDEYIDLVLVHV